MGIRLIDSVRAALAKHHMITAGDTLVVAVSGGPDSLCLLDILRTLRADLGITLHVAHLDHMLRGAESAAEASPSRRSTWERWLGKRTTTSTRPRAPLATPSWRGWRASRARAPSPSRTMPTTRPRRC